MTAGALLDATAPVVALDALSVATEDLLEVLAPSSAADAVEDDALLELLRQTERLRNQLSVVESALIRSAQTRELAERHGQRRTAPWLAQLLRIAPAEATRRVCAAEALTPRTSMTGAPEPARRPTLAAARTSGEVSPESISIVLSTLATLDRRLGDPEPVARAEADLTRYATTFDPPGLRQIAERLVEVYDPDGAEPDDEAAQRRRFFRLRQRTDCSWTGEFNLTPEVGAQLQTVLRSLSTNRSSTMLVGSSKEDGPGDVGPSQQAATGDVGPGQNDDTATASRDAEAERVALPDTRSHGQRSHDALADACALLLRAGELPASGGVPATVIVTVREDQLERGTGLARLAGGGSVPVSTLPRLAGQSDVWMVLTSRHGAPLHLARTRRLASPAQTVALIARDGGCSFPGCHLPPQWCERHHVVEWARGGPTDLSNLTLLCRYHHRHHRERGWRVSINEDGLPEWVPPVWIDPRQRPRVNDRILLDHWSPLESPGESGPGSPGSGRGAVSEQVRGPRSEASSSADLTSETPEDWLDWLELLAPGDIGEGADLEVDDGDDPFDDEEVVAFVDGFVRRTAA